MVSPLRVFASPRLAIPVLAVLQLAPAAPAQDAPATLSIDLLCDQWGAERPRVAGAGRADGAFLVGHRVRWRVGPVQVRTPGVMHGMVAPRLTAAGPTLQVSAGPDTCVQDLVVTLDHPTFADTVARGRLLLAFETAPLRLRRVDAPGGTALIPPAAAHAEPVPEGWQPVVRLAADGRLSLGARTLFDPDEEDQTVAAAVAELVDLPEAHARRVGVDAGGGAQRERTDAELLVVADRWAEVHWLLQILEANQRPGGFASIGLAVTERDHEAALLREAAAAERAGEQVRR